MSESLHHKHKKVRENVERGTDETKRTLDDIADLGSTGKKDKNDKKNGGASGDAGNASSTVTTVDAGTTNMAESPSAELRQQVGRMRTACRERSAEHENFASCHAVCSDAEQKISGASSGSVNDQAHSSCVGSYNQAMGIGSPGSAAAGVTAPPGTVESGQSPMPGVR